MNHDNGARAWCDALSDLLGADVERRGIDVGKFWPRAERADGAASGDKRERRKDHLISGFYANGAQREDERIRTRRHANTVAHATQLGDFLFERGSLFAEHK